MRYLVPISGPDLIGLSVIFRMVRLQISATPPGRLLMRQWGQVLSIRLQAQWN